MCVMSLLGCKFVYLHCFFLHSPLPPLPLPLPPPFLFYLSLPPHLLPSPPSLSILSIPPLPPSGTLNRSETILVFTVVGLVAVLIIIATVMVIAVVISCYFMQRSPQGKYTVKSESLDGAFKRQASLRDNAGIHSSPSNHIFDTLQSPGSSSSAYNNPYTVGPDMAAMPLATYKGPVPLHGGGVPVTNSIFSEAVNSHTSTPIHGTMASTSLFGSEEQTSVTTQLPNFPRANLQVRVHCVGYCCQTYDNGVGIQTQSLTVFNSLYNDMYVVCTNCTL